MENFFYLLLLSVICCRSSNGQFGLFNRQPSQQQSQFGQQSQPQSSFGQQPQSSFGLFNRQPPPQQQQPFGNQQPPVASLVKGNSIIPDGPTPRPTKPYPTPDEECCGMRAQSREDCGYPGIKRSACLRRQCCYDPDPGTNFGCFKPLKKPCIVSSSVLGGGSPVEGTCRIPLNERLDCGYTTELSCKKEQCCWQVRNNEKPRCYYNEKSAPKLSSWGKWSTCTKPCSPANQQERAKVCIYNDGRLAPATFCKGKALENRNCTCEPPCRDDVDEKTCDTWRVLCGDSEVVNKKCRKSCGICKVKPSESECIDSVGTCKNFPQLCNSSETYKRICRLTCKTCAVVSPVILKATARPKRRQNICIDKFKSCKNAAEYCSEESQAEEMMLYCPRTCDMCDLITTEAPPVTLPPNSFLLQTLINPSSRLPAFSLITLATTTASNCVDKYPESCKINKDLCKAENRFAQSMADLCPVTCNACEQSSAASSKDPLLAALSTFPTTSKQLIQTQKPLFPFIIPTIQASPNTPVTTQKPRVPFNFFQPAAATTSSNNCVDKYPDSCGINKDLCNRNNALSQRMGQLCPVTCNTCEQTVDPLLAALYTPAIPTASQQLIETPRTIYPFLPASNQAQSYPPAVQKPATVNIYYPTDAPTAATYIESCENTLDICDQYPSSCRDDSSNWKILCPKTCQTCTSSPATQSPVVVHQGQCVDTVPSCSEFSFMCNQNNDFRRKCQYTCGSCGNAPTANPTPATISLPLQNIGSNVCDDKLTTCQTNKHLCNNGALTVLMKTACKETCGYCSQTGNGKGDASVNSASTQLSQVGPWSSCSVSCGQGVKSRTRYCNQGGNSGTVQGTNCQSGVEYSVCNEGYCVKNNNGR